MLDSIIYNLEQQFDNATGRKAQADNEIENIKHAANKYPLEEKLFLTSEILLPKLSSFSVEFYHLSQILVYSFSKDKLKKSKNILVNELMSKYKKGITQNWIAIFSA